MTDKPLFYSTITTITLIIKIRCDALVNFNF